jgi:hypothetical protein
MTDIKYVFGFDSIDTETGIPRGNAIYSNNSSSYNWLTHGSRNKNTTLDTVCNLVKQGTNFIYLIDFRPGDERTFFEILTIPDEVAKQAKQKKCKICIFAATEYVTGGEIDEGMSNFAKKYDLDKDSLYFITGNYLVSNKKEDKFTYVSYHYFLDFPWFMDKNAPQDADKIIPFKLKNKILCYNRRPRTHRKILIYLLQQEPSLLRDVALTFGGISNSYVVPNDIELLRECIESEELCQAIFTYFQNNQLELKIDDSDLEINLSRDFNLVQHQEAFISLVSETEIREDVLFLSEKTYKPIYAQQPFIIYGNPYSIKELKDLGFKTFDKWIDESYDNEENFEKRLTMILEELRVIASKSLEELTIMRNEMKEVLIHNYKHFLEIDNTEQFFNNFKF